MELIFSRLKYIREKFKWRIEEYGKKVLVIQCHGDIIKLLEQLQFSVLPDGKYTFK